MLQINTRKEIVLFLNGKKMCIQGSEVFLPLAQYLRRHAHLCGTKVVCAEGDCGACTVLVSRRKSHSWGPFQTLNSCIAPVYLFDLSSIITVEGLKENSQLSEVQSKMREFHGGQCGYCTPGMVCSLTSLAEDCFSKKCEISERKARNYLTGNLCRCTGYEPILQAAVHLNLQHWKSLHDRYSINSENEALSSLERDTLEVGAGPRTVFLPQTLAEALTMKARDPQLRIMGGATDLGVLSNKGRLSLDHVLVLQKISELDTIKESAEGLWIGANVSLSQVEEKCDSVFPELSRLFRIFASPQIKNQATLVGNILNGSPIGDSLPALFVLNAEIHLQSNRGPRSILIANFYKGYKSLEIYPDEIAVGVLIPPPQKSLTMKFYKVSLRKDLDISAVTFAAAIGSQDGKITEARFALGGVGPTVIRLPRIEQSLVGQELREATFRAAGKEARKMIKPISDLRASEAYRYQVVENLFNKFFSEAFTNQETLCL